MKCPTCGTSDAGEGVGCSLMIIAIAVLVLAIGTCVNGRLPFCDAATSTVKP